MAFDGPGAFDGDPAFMYLHEVEAKSPSEVRAAMTRAFVAMRPGEYAEVDETVWAWAAAEMVAMALGRPSSPPPPEPFASAGASIPDPEGLVGLALAALDVVVNDQESEIADLWNEGGPPNLDDHLLPLRARLKP